MQVEHCHPIRKQFGKKERTQHCTVVQIRESTLDDSEGLVFACVYVRLCVCACVWFFLVFFVLVCLLIYRVKGHQELNLERRSEDRRSTNAPQRSLGEPI